MVRLFVAAWPTTDALRTLALIPRPTGPGVRWVPEESWHITLRFLGEVDAVEVADRLAGADLPRATARLGPAIEQLGQRQIVVPVDGVDALAGAVRSATEGIGGNDRRPFRGHLTIARLRPNARSSVTGRPVDAEFEIEEIALVSSELRPDRAAYTALARFPTR